MQEPSLPLPISKTLSEVLSVTMDTARLVARPLLRILLPIAGPAILVGALIIGYSYGSIFGATMTLAMQGARGSGYDGGSSTNALTSSFSLMVGFLVLFVSYVQLIVVTQCFMNTCYRLRRIPTPEEAREDRQGAWGRTAGILALCAVVCTVMFILLITVGAGMPLTMIVLLPLFLVAMFYALPLVMIAFAAGNIEVVSVRAAYRRAAELIKGKFWFTFGSLAALSVLVSVLAWCTNLLTMAAGAVGAIFIIGKNGDSSVTQYAIALGYTISLLVSQVLSSIIYMSTVHLYYALREFKELTSVYSMIDTIGEQ